MNQWINCYKRFICCNSNISGQRTKQQAKMKLTASSSGDSSTISTREMQLIVDKLKGERNRSSTKANYYGIWKKFNEFFIRLDEKPSTWEERLVLFVGYLVNENRKSSTIRSYISAIKSVLKDDGEELCENIYLLKSLTNACKLKNDKVCNRLPIRKGLLNLILAEIPKLFKSDQPYLILLYRTLLITAYFGLFRIGEVTKSIHVILAKDIHIGKNKDKLMFVLHSSKTHWFDVKPQVVKISGKEIKGAEGKGISRLPSTRQANFFTILSVSDAERICNSSRIAKKE